MPGKRGGRRQGAGRPKGLVNRATREHKATVGDLARRYTEDAMAALVSIATKGSSESARVAADAARGATEVSIDVSTWNGAFGIGTRFGIVGQYGVYLVTDCSIVSGIATATIWPDLRAAAVTAQYVTLRPTVAMRLAKSDGASLSRGPTTLDGRALSLIEVPDYVVRRYAS